MTATATRLDRILRLPSSIRRRIYLYLGLATWNGLPHTFDLHDRKASTSCDAPPSSFHGLLLSCRAIHAEAAALLYSVNRFLVYYSKPGSLEPLRHLTAPTVACLTSLKVVLNQASCHDNTYDDYGVSNNPSSSAPFTAVSGAIVLPRQPLCSRTPPEHPKKEYNS